MNTIECQTDEIYYDNVATNTNPKTPPYQL